MTGTRASRLMRSIRPLPPRGMIRSTPSGMAMSWPTAARGGGVRWRGGGGWVVCTSCTASCGRPASASACCTSAVSAWFEAMASEPPRRMQALPLLIDRLAGSVVAVGGFDGGVGGVFVDNAEHADRHPHPAYADAAGLLLQALDRTDDVGHGRQLLAALGAG